MGIEHIRNIGALKQSGSDVDIVALCDPVETSINDASLIASSAGFGPKVYHSLSALWSEISLDVIIVSSPNHTHCEVLLEIFDLSKDVHVLVEKPLCTTVDDCLRVIDASEGREGLIWVGLEYRFMPPVARLLRELEAGVTGPIHQMFIREHRFPFLKKIGDWNRFNRNSGGTLVEKCCHFFDLFNLMNAGALPKSFCG